MTSVQATLKPGRERPVEHGHPWIFSGAVASWSHPPHHGQVVNVTSSRGEWLGRGLACPHGNLAIRLYTRRDNEDLTPDFFLAALDRAITLREQVIQPQEPDTNSFRLCFSESDRISGLVIDRYADHASIQIHTSLMMPYLPGWIDALHHRGWATSVSYDAPTFDREGAAVPDVSDAATSPVRIVENGFAFEVDPRGGQKTGFYLDQRVNRRRVAAYARGRKVLGAYCYTGAFEIACAHAGAESVLGIDRSEPALIHAERHLALNPGGAPTRFQVADVGDYLRRCRDSRETFGMIVLDPPKFVHHQAQLDKGLRAYKDINRLALSLLDPGGILATFSCSGWVHTDTFLTAIAWAAKDAGRSVTILERLSQPPDHPVALGFPESDYLCGFVLRTE